MASSKGNSSIPSGSYHESFELLADQGQVERWVEQSLDDGWCAKVKLATRDGVLEVERVEIFHPESSRDGLPTSGGLRDRVIREVRLRVCREYGTAMAQQLQRDPLAGLEYGESIVERRARRPGRPKQYSIVDDLCLAEMYVKELAEDARRVNARVAERLGPTYTARWVAKRVHKLREGDDALLTTTSRGTPGGRLTEYALQLRGDVPQRREGRADEM